MSCKGEEGRYGTQMNEGPTLDFLTDILVENHVMKTHHKLYYTFVCFLLVMFYGFDPMVFITMNNHHLGEYVWNFFQAPKSCKIQDIYGLESSSKRFETIS